jgi:hypothetical protein
MRRLSGVLAVLFSFALGSGIGSAATARAEVLASAPFDTNPAPADSRITFNNDGTITAHYNSLRDTDKVLFPLSHPLTAADSFTVTTRFKIASTGFSADPFGFAQITFGLCNSITTGTDRSTTATTNGDTFDSFALDYFPNISTAWASPSLSPTIFSSRTGTESAIPNDIYSVYKAESALNDPGEAPLPFDTWMNAALVWNPATRQAILSMSTDAGPMFINAGGGLDGDTSTIQLTLPEGVDFNVDRYALMLWKDAWCYESIPSVQADLTFDSFSVTAAPEPATIALFGLAALGLMARRPTRRR